MSKFQIPMLALIFSVAPTLTFAHACPRATCYVFDHRGEPSLSLGPVFTESAYSVENAFAVATRRCELRAQRAGYPATFAGLVTELSEATYTTQTSSQSSEFTHGYASPWHYWTRIEYRAHSHTYRSRHLYWTPATPSNACDETGPRGNPSDEIYTGPATPLR